MQKRFYGWVVLVLLALLSLWPYLGKPLPVQTNVLAMLPDDARQPDVEAAISKLSARAGERLVWMVGHADAATASRLAAQSAASLQTLPMLKTIHGQVGAVDPARFLQPYAAYRFGLLTAHDRQMLQGDAGLFLQGQLLQRLTMPGQGALGLPLAEDPFGLFGNVVAGLPLAASRLQVQDGWLAVERDGVHWRLLSAPLAGNAYDPALQQVLSGALEKTGQQVTSVGGKFVATGAVLFASEAYSSAEAEMNWIGTVSLLAVIVLMLLVFRSIRHLLLSGVVIAAGMLLAVAATLAVYGQLHLMTLVMGASLIGVAVDYSTHLFASQLQDGKDWQVGRTVQAIYPAIRMGLLTTLLGYAALALLPFPGLRQIAFFSSVGLVGAYLTVLWCVPVFVQQPAAPAAARVLPLIGRAFAAYCRALRGRRLAVLLVLLAIITLPGLTRLQADDDVRQLIKPSAALLADESLIRSLTGQGNSRQFFLLSADSEAALLTLAQQLGGRLDGLVARGELSSYQSLASLLLPPAQQQADYRLQQQALYKVGRKLLQDAGLRDEVVAQYLAAAARPLQVLDAQTLLAQPLAAPLRHLWLGEDGGQWRMAVMPGDFKHLASLQQATKGLPGVTLVDKAASVSGLFHQFRESASWMFGLSLIAIVVMMRQRYGWRRAFLLAAPVSLSVLFTFGVLGWLGVSANLFVTLGFLMVLGVGVDYAIFVEEGRHHHQLAALLAVAVSALATLLSFGLLALSATPAVSSFGLTQLIGVGFAVLLAPMVSLSGTTERQAV